MVTIKCDRCGKLTEYMQPCTDVHNYIGISVGHDSHYDLCPECSLSHTRLRDELCQMGERTASALYRKWTNHED